MNFLFTVQVLQGPKNLSALRNSEVSIFESILKYCIKVTGYSSLVLFKKTLHGLWTDAISAVECLFFEPKIASSIYGSEET